MEEEITNETSSHEERSVLGIHMFLGLPDPDPLVRGADPDPAPYLFLMIVLSWLK